MSEVVLPMLEYYKIIAPGDNKRSYLFDQESGTFDSAFRLKQALAEICGRCALRQACDPASIIGNNGSLVFLTKEANNRSCLINKNDLGSLVVNVPKK